MKNILIRASVLPFENVSVEDAVFNDTIWGNSGNLLFVYSVLRNIYHEDLHVDKYKNANVNDAEWINQKYDMLLIPLANAFRENWIASLENWAKLIEKLTIPCIVIGVGLQTKYDPQFTKDGYKFDNAVRRFVQAVLEKSSTIGVRGEITATYLKKLGFPEDKIDVIGCPSMFMFGEYIPRKTPHAINKDSKISISYHGVENNFFEFLERCKNEYPNYYIIPQGIYDLRLLYSGDRIKPAQKNVNELYVQSVDYKEFQENKLRQFINVPSWINFLRDIDVSIGSCIHGSIAAILAGNPTIVFAADSRVRELSEYHHIPMIRMSDIDERTTLSKIYEKIDFSDMLKGHQDRYRNYISFLNKNGIETKNIGGNIYTEFDKKVDIDNSIRGGGISCLTSLDKDRQMEQLKKYLCWVEKKINWFVQQINEENASDMKNGMETWIDSLQCTINNINNC